MPNVSATNTYGNGNPIIGGAYLDYHVPSALARLRNTMASAWAYPETGAVPTINANDSSGTATSTNEPQFASQYSRNNTTAELEQGRMI